MALRRFRLGYTSRAVEQAERLHTHAERHGVGEAFLAAMARIVGLLKRNPLSFGEPQYNTRLPGGVVCHGIKDDILVRFVVYRRERTVLVLDFLDVDELRTREE